MNNNINSLKSFWVFYLLAFVIGTIALGFTFYIAPDAGMQMYLMQKKLGLNDFNVLVPIMVTLENFSKGIYAPGLIFPVSPAIAAIIVIAWFQGKSGVKKLFGRFKPWHGSVSKDDAIKVYVKIFILAFVAILLGLALNSVFVGPEKAINTMVDNLRLDAPLLAIVLFFAATFTNTGGLLEELGWRGFAQPVLQKLLRTPLHAAVLVGVLWALWHFPRDVLKPLFTGAEMGDVLLGYLEHLATYIPYCIASSIVIAYFFNQTGGSVIPAIMIHGFGNYYAVNLYVEGTPFAAWSMIEMSLAVIIVFKTGTQLGRIDENKILNE